MNPDLDSNDENPYDFIFKQEKAATPGGSGPNKLGANNRQMFVFGGFVVAVLLVAMIAFTLITSANKDNGLEAISVRAYQAEIGRVLDAGNKNITDSELMRKLVTLEVVLLTDQSKIGGVIARKGIEPTESQIAQYRRASRDTALSNSLQVDRHDEVFEEVIDDLVESYYSSIRTAQGVARTNKELSALTEVRESIDIIYNLNEQQESSEQAQPEEATTPTEQPQAN